MEQLHCATATEVVGAEASRFRCGQHFPREAYERVREAPSVRAAPSSKLGSSRACCHSATCRRQAGNAPGAPARRWASPAGAPVAKIRAGRPNSGSPAPISWGVREAQTWSVMGRRISVVKTGRDLSEPLALLTRREARRGGAARGGQPWLAAYLLHRGVGQRR